MEERPNSRCKGKGLSVFKRSPLPTGKSDSSLAGSAFLVQPQQFSKATVGYTGIESPLPYSCLCGLTPPSHIDLTIFGQLGRTSGKLMSALLRKPGRSRIRMPQEKEGRRLCCRRANIAAGARARGRHVEAQPIRCSRICEALVQILGRGIGVEGRRHDRHWSRSSWSPIMERQSQSQEDCAHDLDIIDSRLGCGTRLGIPLDVVKKGQALLRHTPY